MKLLTTHMHVGGSICVITLTMSGSAMMLSSLIMKPRYGVSFYINLHFDSFNLNCVVLGNENFFQYVVCAILVMH